MSLSWVATSKLVPPEPPAGWVRRALGDGAPVVVLSAGPGYGKSLALRALWDDAPAGAVTVWYGLDEDDADVATFFSHLAAGLAAHAPQFGEELLALVGAGKLEPKLLWQRLFQAIAAYDPPAFVLALDDVHRLGDPAILEGLAPWLGKLPPRTRVLLASRRKLPIPLARLQAQGTARVLGPEALRFNPGEIATFFAQRIGPGDATAPSARPDPQGLPAAWKAALETLEGWPLGLELLAAGHALPAGGALLAGGAPGDLLADFIAEELVAAQPADRRDFMLRAALLHEPTAEALATALARPLDEVTAALEALEADQLVFRLTRGSHGARIGAPSAERWRYPAYLADWLRREGARRVPAAEAAEVHRRAAAGLMDAELPEAALPHLVAAQDWQAAIAACQAAFPLMSVYGRKAAIQRVLAGFPPAVAQAAPFLLLWAGNAHARALRWAEAGEAYERARAAYAARGDAEGELKILVRLATMALWTGDDARFATLRAEAEARLAAGRPEDRIDYHLTCALAAESAGDEAGTKAHNEAVIAVPAAGNAEAAQGRALALINLHTWALQRGRLVEAARHAEEAVRVAEEWRFFGPLRLATLLAANLDLVTEVPGGSAVIEALPAFWEDPLSWSELAVALTIVGHHHQARGDWKRADDALKRATDIFVRAGFREGMLVPLERRLWGTLLRETPARAAELVAEVAPLGTKSYYELAPRVPLARALQLTGKAEEAVAELAYTIAGAARIGADLLVARARLFEAAAHLAIGDVEGARVARAAADALIDARGYGFLRAHDARLQEELRALDGQRTPSALSVAQAPILPNAIAGKKGAAPPAGRLRVKALGALEVEREGVVLDQWPRRKSKLVLGALLLRPRGIDAYDLAELIEDGAPVAGSLHALQMAISALRRVLEPGQEGKREASRYVYYRDDRYGLEWEMVDDYDVRMFDAALDAGDATKGRDAATAAKAYEEAAALVSGPLLADTLFAGRFDAEREHYRRRALGAMLWLGDHYGSLMRRDQAEAMYARAIALAPTDEDAYLALMRHQRLAGRPERVRQAYWDCRKALKARLGIQPSPTFESAYRELAGT